MCRHAATVRKVLPNSYNLAQQQITQLVGKRSCRNSQLATRNKLKMKSSRRFAILGAVCLFILVLHIFIEGKLLRESNVDYEVAPHVVATVQERSNQRSDQQEPQEQQDGSSANSASNSTSTNAVQNIKKAAVCYQQQLLNLHLLKNLNLHLSPADKIPILWRICVHRRLSARRRYGSNTFQK